MIYLIKNVENNYVQFLLFYWLKIENKLNFLYIFIHIFYNIFCNIK